MFLLLRFTESGKINCSDWKQILQLCNKIGAKGSESLTNEIRRCLHNVVTKNNVWRIVELLPSFDSYGAAVAQVC